MRRERRKDLVRAIVVIGWVYLLSAAGVLGSAPLTHEAEGLSADCEIYSYRFLHLDEPGAATDANGVAMLTFAGFDANDVLVWTQGFEGLDAWLAHAAQDPALAATKTEQAGWQLAGGNEDVFWQLRVLVYLCPEYENILTAIESRPLIFNGNTRTWVAPGIELSTGFSYLDQFTVTVYWNPDVSSVYGGARQWDRFPPLVVLAHEVLHAYQRIAEDRRTYTTTLEPPAIQFENLIRYAFYRKVPGHADLRPRPGIRGFYFNNDFQYLFDDVEWLDWPASHIPMSNVYEQE